MRAVALLLVAGRERNPGIAKRNDLLVALEERGSTGLAAGHVSTSLKPGASLCFGPATGPCSYKSVSFGAKPP
jgi:hypothetical protein